MSRQDLLREAILAGDAETAERLAAELLRGGERINPTSKPLPKGDVVVCYKQGFFRRRRPSAASDLERVGAAIALRSQLDVRHAAQWFANVHADEAEGFAYLAEDDAGASPEPEGDHGEQE